jgi:hypothetical protein
MSLDASNAMPEDQRPAPIYYAPRRKLAFVIPELTVLFYPFFVLTVL